MSRGGPGSEALAHTVRSAVGGVLAIGIATMACEREAAEIEFCPAGSTAVVGGCLPIPGAETDDGGASGADASGTDTGDAGRSDGGVNATFAGRWALEVTTQQEVANPVLGTAVRMTQMFAVIDVDRDQADVYSTRFELCAVRPDPFMAIETTYPDVAIQAANPFDATTVAVANDEIEVAGFGFLMGWSVDAPREGDVPINADDERIVDADADGNPGVTLNRSGAETGDIYVASRTQFTLTGRATAMNAIAGTSVMTDELEIVGASDAEITVEESTLTQADPPGANVFRMLRLADDDDCVVALERL